ncbi:MAG: class II fructose-bisphosphate aldolase [bacterium]|nr:class II fructose-bisphosphate aldolase [bacterium]
MLDAKTLMLNAYKAGTVIPSFNIPYLPMMEAVIQALQETQCFGQLSVSRPDWEKFEAKSIRAIYERYQELKDERVTGLHLDHVPVIDEDQEEVDYLSIVAEAVELGYESVMVDASRLSLEGNIAATKKVVEIAHAEGIAVEAELGAVMGHEDGPMPSYEELFTSGMGFTEPAEAKQFVDESGVDWLSVAVGSVHGALSKAKRSEKKVDARLNIERIQEIRNAIDRPLVLHGGSGIQKAYLLDAFKTGVSKLNIGTAIRQAYEQGAKTSEKQGQENVYRTALNLIKEELEIEGSAKVIHPE